MEEIIIFLSAHEPWSELEPQLLAEVAGQLQIEYFPRGRLIIQGGGAAPAFLYLVRSGAVELRQPSSSGGRLIDRLGEGEVFGATSVLSDDPPLLDCAAVEDTLAYLLPRSAFSTLLEEPSFERFFLATLRDRVAHALQSQGSGHGDDPGLFSMRLGDLLQRPLVSCRPDERIAAVARQMCEANVSSMVVLSNPVGIVTDRDLRTNVLAAGLSPELPISRVMTAPAITLGAESLVFEALLLMVERHLHHLPVTSGGQVVGVVTNTDLLRRQSRSPLLLPRLLERARGQADYVSYARQVAVTVGSMLDSGVSVSAIGRVVALAHDALLQKIIAVGEQRLGPPPCPYAWLTLGSEGRLEQSLRTDQDNALIYADDAPADTDRYFAALAEFVVEQLVACGFPRCPGEVNATNGRWRQPLHVWKSYFRDWIGSPDEVALLRVGIFFDYRQVAGTLDAQAALQPIVRRSQEQRIFLGRLARAALRTTPPLGFFRRLLVESDGAYKDMLDLKHRGTALVVDLARLFALQAGSAEVNTFARLQDASARSSLATVEADELALAYEFISTLRLRCQVEQLRRGEQPNNFVRPSALSDIDRRQLKEAFGVISHVQEGVKVTFQIGLMS